MGDGSSPKLHGLSRSFSNRPPQLVQRERRRDPPRQDGPTPPDEGGHTRVKAVVLSAALPRYRS
jgi:hypothetical protein